MQTKQRPLIQIRDTGDLIAAVPHLLGFRPAESLVICVYSGSTRTQITLCLRADIPPPELYWSLAEQLKLPVLRANSCGVSVIVVGAGTVDPPNPLPHKQLVDAVTQVFGSAGVVVQHAFWAPAIDAGVTWWCYTDLECNGPIPDPGASELAVAAVTMGSVTYDSRAELRATLEPVDRQPLSSRADRIAAALPTIDEARGHKVVTDVLAQVRDGTWALEEDRLVELAAALKHVRVRDSCLSPAVLALGRPVEDLWSELTRATPVPYRAEPACLLAVTAFLRGDGVLAGVAIDIVLEADPEHPVANLLRQSMDFGLPPDAVSRAIAKSFPGE